MRVDDEGLLRTLLAACDETLQNLSEAEEDALLIEDVRALRAKTEARLAALGLDHR